MKEQQTTMDSTKIISEYLIIDTNFVNYSLVYISVELQSVLNIIMLGY
jgi:hypothetical protein